MEASPKLPIFPKHPVKWKLVAKLEVGLHNASHLADFVPLGLACNWVLQNLKPMGYESARPWFLPWFQDFEILNRVGILGDILQEC